MYIYKCIQRRSTCVVTAILIRRKPLLPGDCAFMRYTILAEWYDETLGV